MKRAWIIAGTGSAIVLAAVVGVMATGRRPIQSSGNDVPLAEVRKGDLEVKVYTTGELRANNTMVLTAPPVAGGALQITRLLHPGTPVKKGDLIFEFDPAEQLYKLQQSRSELQQGDQEITKANADAAVQSAQDKVALLKAKFDVRRAELDIQKNELVSAIDGKKNQLALEQARKALAKLQQDIQSHTVSGQASILLAKEKRNKAKLAMDTATDNIAKMRVLSPMDGLVSIEKNQGAMGEIMFAGMTLPEYRAGDQVQPGSAIAQIVDAQKMELTGKISERDRSNIRVGHPVEVEFDAEPGHIFHGTVKTVGGMSVTQFWETGMGGRFDVSIELKEQDASLRPGLTAQIVIVGDKKANVLYLPSQALLMKDGKRVVFVKRSKGFEQVETKVVCENESHAAIEGLKLGDEVALLDPTKPKKSDTSGGNSGMGGGKP
jgi:HlyD family secretion protein